MMRAHPLESIGLDDAIRMQFKLVDVMSRHFPGCEALGQGDLGLVPGLNQPATTRKVEEVIADFFGGADAVLVRGAGTGALRQALASVLSPGRRLLVHQAPIYPTTLSSIEEMGIVTIALDYNDPVALQMNERLAPIDAALVQLARQKIDDRYDAGSVVRAIKSAKDIPVITDDNYAVMKVRSIGVEMGADLSTFSLFKLLGPEGVGCVVGRGRLVASIRKKHYSGGCQIQGHEALAALRMLAYAPVAFAIQARACDEIAQRLQRGEIRGVKDAFICNAQSRVLLVELEKENAQQVLQKAEALGALPYPVGSESLYEVQPLFYRISGTFKKDDPSLERRMIRINPMRSGPDTVMRILKTAIEQAEVESCT